MKMKEVSIEKTANMITEAFKKASEDAKKTVDALMTDDVKKKPTDDIITVPNDTPYNIIKKQAEYRRYIKELEGDKEILKAECIALKEKRGHLEDANRHINRELSLCEQKLTDAKKTISKMQQTHEAEVQDLKDKLDEARADAAVAEKNHARAVGEKNDYADALDNDSVAFEEILGLAILMERSAKSMHEVSKMIQAKTEGLV